MKVGKFIESCFRYSWPHTNIIISFKWFSIKINQKAIEKGELERRIGLHDKAVVCGNFRFIILVAGVRRRISDVTWKKIVFGVGVYIHCRVEEKKHAIFVII